MPSFTVLESSCGPATEPFLVVDSADREPVYSDEAPQVTETRHDGRPDVRRLLEGQHYYTVYLPSTGAYMHVAQRGRLNSAFCWYAHNRGTRSPEELRAMRGTRAVVEYRSREKRQQQQQPRLLSLLHWRNLAKMGAALGLYLAARLALGAPHAPSCLEAA